MKTVFSITDIRKCSIELLTKLILSVLILFVIGLMKVQAQTVKDIDGNVYKTITIGTQVWMAQNLKTTKYSNGDLIGTTTPDSLDISMEFEPKYQWAYEGNKPNVAIYGRLYTWYVVNDNRKLCPTGWHVPSDEEWGTLVMYLGGPSIAGGKLKEKGTIHWKSPNNGATNESGFTALPGGYRGAGGTFANIGGGGAWWTSTECSSSNAINMLMNNKGNSVSGMKIFPKITAYSVRCLRD
jgi:uncharacterized protein (TIGR02145 family)